MTDDREAIYSILRTILMALVGCWSTFHVFAAIQSGQWLEEACRATFSPHKDCRPYIDR